MSAAPHNPAPSIEGGWARTKRKFNENPFIPLGLAVSVYGLLSMFRSITRRDATAFQTAQRLRVGGQLFATVCLVGGLYLGFGQSKPLPAATTTEESK